MLAENAHGTRRRRSIELPGTPTFDPPTGASLSGPGVAPHLVADRPRSPSLGRQFIGHQFAECGAGLDEFGGALAHPGHGLPDHGLGGRLELAGKPLHGP